MERNCDAGLDQRCRDEDGTIRRKRSNTLQLCGESMAKTSRLVFGAMQRLAAFSKGRRRIAK
jgi:hypothetical protein